MGILISNLSYAVPAGEQLFDDISLSLGRHEKASLTGDNGTGKTTLLRLIAGELPPAGGNVAVDGVLYFVPQHYGQYDGVRICDAMGAGHKLDALAAIETGSTAEEDFAALGDQWDICDRISEALEKWGLGGLDPATPMQRMSGGEKTRVLLAGTTLHGPDIILLDEPTNHLDRRCREMLYRFVDSCPATMLAVSHDRTLLDLFGTTLELSRGAIRRYGGNYTFYREQRQLELSALENSIAESEKARRKARRTEAESMERKQKRDSRGKKKMAGEGTPRIMLNTIRDGAEKSASNLAGRHAGKIEDAGKKITALRAELPPDNAIKIKMDGSGLHAGKILVNGRGLNHTYPGGKPLWPCPLDLLVASGDRLLVNGSNGSGKTTLLKMITGNLIPTEGSLERARFTYVYVDQEYSLVVNRLTVIEQLESFNRRNIPPHLLRTELDRYLFPAAAWDKPCGALSGGEKMRLALCCILTADNAPEMLILDEPTNNLDIRSMEILASAVRDYKGTLVLITHDRTFARDAGVRRTLDLDLWTIS